ncbi:MAG: ATP-dependent Zn protease, partial [Microcystis sp. M49629_WE12]|nr:ATP-dependent Zn protease [Microcystis sp. M49629_WE12]
MEQTALNLIAITVFSITLSVFVTPLLSISPFVPA